MFDYQTKDTLRGLQPDLLAMQRSAADEPLLRPAHRNIRRSRAGRAARPTRRVQDYENSLKRDRDFAANIDEAIRQWKRGEAEGVVDTKLTVRNMIEQLNAQLKLTPEASPYWGPIKSFPARSAPADRARLTTAYRASITGVIYPALTRMRDFLQNEYLGHAREGVGLMYMKGGPSFTATSSSRRRRCR